MFWTLIVLTTLGAPVPTGMIYPTLETCYAAEREMATEYARYYNSARVGASEESAELLRSRMLRGICVPQEGLKIKRPT